MKFNCIQCDNVHTLTQEEITNMEKIRCPDCQFEMIPVVKENNQ